MSIPKISSLKQPALNFALLIFLAIIIAIFYGIFVTGRDFLIASNIFTQDSASLAKENFIKNLKFDYKISSVVDGDTLYIERLDGEKVEGVNEKIKVRLIGINSPETVDPRKPVECFGKEASKYLKSIADGRVAAIELDPSQGKLDKYGRLLAYVYVKNSGVKDNNISFINEEMIKNGYAYEYTYSAPYMYMDQFKYFQQIAEANYIGLWSTNTCSGLKTPVAPPPSE